MLTRDHAPAEVSSPAARVSAHHRLAIRKTTCTLLTMLAALAIPYATPRLRPFRVVKLPWETSTLVEDAPAIQAAWAAANAAAGQQMLPPSENRPTVNNALPRQSNPVLPDIDPDLRSTLRPLPIVDPSGHALDAFFERLARTDRKEPGAITRILHYGDSTIASDYVSGTVRRRLQARFGDAGHGFLLIANPWEWYFHNDVFHASEGEWMASKLAGPTASDRMYGLGGVSFMSYGGGVAWFGTATRGEYGRRASRFDVYYLEQPGGGDLELSVRGGASERISTRSEGEAKVSRAHSVHVADGESKLTVRAAGGGPVRLFGVALERDVPGVVYDALGAHAAMAVYWQRQDRAHWRDQLALRDPALIVVQYGTNESDLWRLDREEYERAFSELLDELKEIAPLAAVLVVAPLDRAEQRGGRLLTKRVIVDLVTIQERVAGAHGVAFWNTFEAMGGEGSMSRWARAKPQLGGGDLTHPTPLGAEILGDMLSDAIVAAYDGRRQRTYPK
jgi:lysophospholipase L1-like esterase